MNQVTRPYDLLKQHTGNPVVLVLKTGEVVNRPLLGFDDNCVAVKGETGPVLYPWFVVLSLTLPQRGGRP
jgi:hypothetical protein